MIMVDLLCCERELASSIDCESFKDPLFTKDNRILQNLLLTEDNCIVSRPNNTDFSCMQKEITTEMRKIVADWMLEVCEDQRCQEDVFPLAMNYLDRFLSVCGIRKTQLQLLGSVCLFLSSKLKEYRPISPERLIVYTDRSICHQDLLDWELLVLEKLKWDISCITPNDFLDQILQRIPNKLGLDFHKVRTHAQTFISLCATDYKFSLHPPSMIAAAAIGAAVQGLLSSVANDVQHRPLLNELMDLLNKITNIESDLLKNCLEQIEELVAEVAGGSSHPPEGPSTQRSSSRDKLGEHKAVTPTDIRDVHF